MASTEAIFIKPKKGSMNLFSGSSKHSSGSGGSGGNSMGDDSITSPSFTVAFSFDSYLMEHNVTSNRRGSNCSTSSSISITISENGGQIGGGEFLSPLSGGMPVGASRKHTSANSLHRVCEEGSTEEDISVASSVGGSQYHYGSSSNISSTSVAPTRRSNTPSMEHSKSPFLAKASGYIEPFFRGKLRSAQSDSQFQTHLQGRRRSQSTTTRPATETIQKRPPIALTETTRLQVQKGTSSDNPFDQVNQYRLMKIIGHGSYGAVHLGQNVEDGTFYAIKEISKNRLRRDKLTKGDPSKKEDASQKLLREVAVLKKISAHPYFVRLVEFLNDNDGPNVYMVFDLCENGTVMSMHRGKAEPLSEETSRRYFRQLLLAVEYLHYNRIVHRDIKPDNILLNANHEIQIADFGVAHMFDADDLLQSSAGSPAFLSPEICSCDVANFHGKAVDIWAMGVTLYCFVMGCLPFRASNVLLLYREIIQKKPDIPESLGLQLCDLLRKMLEKNPANRITIPEIRVHPWVTNFGAMPLPSTEENCEFVEVTPEEVRTAITHKSLKKKLKEMFFKDKEKEGGKNREVASPEISPNLSFNSRRRFSIY